MLKSLQMPTPTHRVASVATVIAGAALLLWPAVYNGFPLLYPDSMTYLADGAPVARALFLHRFSDYYGLRSLLYSLVILPFHGNATVWPVAVLQCLLAGWVLWQTVRVLIPGIAPTGYLGLMAVLSLSTSLSWYAVFIMPDLLGPLTYLSLFLLVFPRGRLAVWERLSLGGIATWGAAAHATHLVLAAGLCAILALLAQFRQGNLRRRFSGVAQGMAAVALAALMQIGLNAYLYGVAEFDSERPPFLLARVIADGPGRQYLASHCDRAQWAVCAYRGTLRGDSDDFLWSGDGVFENASPQEQGRIRNEEMPLVLASFQAYPADQLRRSAANFRDQLLAFGLFGFDPNPWILEEFKVDLPAGQEAYRRSRQARGLLPLDGLSSFQAWTVCASLVVIAAVLAFGLRRLSLPMLALTVTIFSVVAGNAVLTGILSGVDDRYGCRVIWVIPLLAGLLLLDLENRFGQKVPKPFPAPSQP